MLLLAAVFFAGVVAVGAFAARWGARRLRLELMDILLWLGLAERPTAPIPRVRHLEPPVVLRGL